MVAGEVCRGSSLIQPVKTTRPVSKASQAVDRTRSWISTLLHPRQSRVDRVRSRHKHGIRHWSKLREDGDEGDEDAERDRIERERRVILAKRATLDARVIVQAAEKQGKLPALQDLIVEESWKAVLSDEFEKDYFLKLERFLHCEQLGETPIYPPMECIFRALNSTPFEDVRVVILGQDPYHGENQATGLSFSVPKGTRLPSSLQNIFKELNQDLCVGIPSHGDLSSWSAQGVLLLNTVLTVRARQPNSHRKMGWEELTDSAIKALSSKRHGLLFVLWGRQAQQKATLVDDTKHHILHSAHPSGLSAHKGFFGSRPFSRINQQLASQGSKPIEWWSIHPAGGKRAS